MNKSIWTKIGVKSYFMKAENHIFNRSWINLNDRRKHFKINCKLTPTPKFLAWVQINLIFSEITKQRENVLNPQDNEGQMFLTHRNVLPYCSLLCLGIMNTCPIGNYTVNWDIFLFYIKIVQVLRCQIVFYLHSRFVNR